MLSLGKINFFIFLSLLGHTFSRYPYMELTIWEVEPLKFRMILSTPGNTIITPAFFDTTGVYIIQIVDNEEDIFLYSWVGNSSQLDIKKKAVDVLVNLMIENNDARPATVSVVRIAEGYEGCFSYFKSVFSVQSKCPKDPALYKVKADNNILKSNYIVKVPANVNELNQNYSFLLNSQTNIYVWHGSKTIPGNRIAVYELCQYLKVMKNFSGNCTTQDTDFNVFKSKFKVSEQNTMSIKEEPSADNQQFQTIRYSSKYRMIKEYFNGVEKDVTKKLLKLNHLKWKKTYFLMDRLTMDKFIFLGPNSTPQDIKAVMIAAEKFIFENAEGGSMVEIIQWSRTLPSKIPSTLLPNPLRCFTMYSLHECNFSGTDSF